MRTISGLTALFFSAIGGVFLLAACPVPENKISQDPVASVTILSNQTASPAITILESHSVILGARLSPLGVQGGIHWQSSRQGIIQMSELTGPELTATGLNGGRTIISVLSRNIHNKEYARAELIIKVIPSSFFKWSYREDGWLDLPPQTPAMAGKITEMLVRSGDTEIKEDIIRKGLVLEGPGVLVLGSGMSTLTNSPFSDHPVYDKGGALDFWNGPKRPDEPDEAGGNTDYHPFWNQNKKVRISVDYEALGDIAPLRIQVNNNTLMRNNASAISNWLVAELTSASPRTGTLTGTFNALATEIDTNKIAASAKEEILSHSFVCLALPEGKMVIRNIRIEITD